MTLIHTKCGDDTRTPVEISVLFLSVADHVNPPKLPEHEVNITDEDKRYHPKTAMDKPFEESIPSKHDDLKFQHYATTIALSTEPLDFNRAGILLRRSR